MSKIKTFFLALFKSVTTTSYYHEIIKAPFSFSLKYFYFFFFLLSLITTIISGIFLNQYVPPFVARVEKYARELFPDDLTVEIKSGKLNINRPAPFTVPIPIELIVDQPVAVSDQKRVYMFVYDPAAEIVSFDSYNSLVVANEQIIMMQDQNNGVRAFPVKDMEDVTLTKPMIDDMLNKVIPYTRYIVPTLVALIFFSILIFIPSSKLISLLFLSLITYFLGTVFVGVKLPFKKYYQLGLHAMTLPTLVELGFLLTGKSTPFPMFITIFFVLYSLIILASLKKENHISSTSEVE